MPVDRIALSVSQFSELLGIDPDRLLAVEVIPRSGVVTIILEPRAYAPGLGEHASLGICGCARCTGLASPDAMDPVFPVPPVFIWCRCDNCHITAWINEEGARCACGGIMRVPPLAPVASPDATGHP